MELLLFSSKQYNYTYITSSIHFKGFNKNKKSVRNYLVQERKTDRKAGDTYDIYTEKKQGSYRFGAKNIF